MTLINGCTIGDIFGEYTNVNYNGKSVVDYAATSHNLKHLVNSFKVLDLTKYSDHKPNICNFNVYGNLMPSKEILKGLEDVPQYTNTNGTTKMTPRT